MAEWELGPRVREPWAEEEGPERACLELAVAVSAEPVSRERAAAAAEGERPVWISAQRAVARGPAVRRVPKVARAWLESPVSPVVAEPVAVVPWREPVVAEDCLISENQKHNFLMAKLSKLYHLKMLPD